MTWWSLFIQTLSSCYTTSWDSTPKFIDYHEKAPQLPPEVMQQAAQAINAKQADEFGGVPINAFMGTKGEAFCMTEAPSADAVVQSHEAKGMTLDKGDVHEVQSLV